MLYLDEVCDISEAMIVRNIRNDARLFMTNSTDWISEDDQKKWFESLDHSNMIFLMKSAPEQKVLGYGIIKSNSDRRGILTGAIVEGQRSNGYGKILFYLLIARCYELGLVPALEVLKTNMVALKLYNRIGFSTRKVLENTYYMEIQ